MPMYDFECTACKAQKINELRRISESTIPCTVCGADMVRMWTSSGTPHGDEIDVTVRHGLCNEDGTPRRFTSKTELAKAAELAGMTNYVEHVPERGSDKSKHTVRWISCPVQSEEERLRVWHEHEDALQRELQQ